MTMVDWDIKTMKVMMQHMDIKAEKAWEQDRKAMSEMERSCIISHIRIFPCMLLLCNVMLQNFFQGKICDNYLCDWQHQLHILLLFINMHFSFIFVDTFLTNFT